MPPTRLEKLQAYAEHLLDVFIGLREKYALLDPLIFDRDTIRLWSTGPRGRGFITLKNSLFMSCLMDVSKIAIDSDDRTPNVLQLVDFLEEEGLRDSLREQFSVWQVAPTTGETGEDIALLQAAERREEDERRKQFDALVTELRDRSLGLRESKVLASCRTIRDKLLAHSELHHDGESYKPFDVTSLGLKWGSLKQVIAELEQLVNLITRVCRSSSFAFDMLDEHLAKASRAFWAPASPC